MSALVGENSVRIVFRRGRAEAAEEGSGPPVGVAACG